MENIWGKEAEKKKNKKRKKNGYSILSDKWEQDRRILTILQLFLKITHLDCKIIHVI